MQKFSTMSDGHSKNVQWMSFQMNIWMYHGPGMQLVIKETRCMSQKVLKDSAIPLLCLFSALLFSSTNCFSLFLYSLGCPSVPKFESS